MNEETEFWLVPVIRLQLVDSVCAGGEEETAHGQPAQAGGCHGCHVSRVTILGTAHVSLAVMASRRRVTRSAPGTRAWWSWWGVTAGAVSVLVWTRGRAARDCRAAGCWPALAAPPRTPVCPPVFLPHKFPGVLATVGPWPGTVVTLLDLSTGLREISQYLKAPCWDILLVSLC